MPVKYLNFEPTPDNAFLVFAFKTEFTHDSFSPTAILASHRHQS